jgi:SNF2 family DNA or RNA helicase
MLRRMKSDVLKDSMPMKKWVEVPCALTDSQRDLYINILEKNYSKLNSAIQSGQFKIHSLAFIVTIHFTTLSSSKSFSLG